MFVALDLELLVLQREPEADVIVCATVEEALSYVDDEIALALLDIDVVDGKTFDLATTLRRKGWPVVFVSGSPSHDVPAHLSSIPFIAKPYSAPIVTGAVATLLGGRRS